MQMQSPKFLVWFCIKRWQVYCHCYFHNMEGGIVAMCYLSLPLSSGEGQLLKVSLDSVDEGESPPLPGEWFDFSAQHFIKMDDLNPFVYTEKTITVKNHTYVSQFGAALNI